VFKSLQARLILSYVIVIVVCLALVGLAALLLLRGYQRNLIYSRLTDRVALAAGLTSQMLRRGTSPQEAVERLSRQMDREDRQPISVYLLDLSGHVVAGSDAKLDQLSLGQLIDQPARPQSPRVRGEQRLAAGTRLLYVAEAVRPSLGEAQRAATHVLILGELYRPVRLALGDLVPRLMWAGAIALALSVVVAAFMAYSIARPLERIALAAEEVAAGNYDQELDIGVPVEVARLATSFNSMARQVQATLQSQQDLVANVSHELKTPLTSIQGFSQALLDGTASDPPARERAAIIIHTEAGRMRRLVDDLLDLARLEAGQVTLARDSVDIVDVLRGCVARLGPQSEQTGSTLLLELPPSLSPVVGDADRLGQVFANLVDNALEHVRNVAGGGRVEIQAAQGDHVVVCSVTDNGPGIPTEDLPRIFERFYQVDKSRVRREGGAGLGLAIAREIIESHGGRIRALAIGGAGLEGESMQQKRMYVDGKTLCTGVRKASSRTEDPILCLIKADKITLVAVSGLRLVVSWEARLREPAPGNLAFLIPPLVARLLSCEAICGQVGIAFSMQGQHVTAKLTDHLGSYEFRWQSDFSSFKGPAEFAHLIQAPQTLVSVPHLRFSDASHQAVAKLGYMHADRQISPTKLAILIDLNFGRLLVDGEEIVTTESHRYYYDPRLVIRALEFLKEETLRVGITPLPSNHRRGYLSLLCKDGGWTVHCALLSIGHDTQRLYQLSPGRNR
jgi:signal transduction histidine kinase